MLSSIIMGIKGGVFIAAACWLFARLLRPEDAKWIRGAPTFLAIFIFVLGAFAYNVWLYYVVLLFLIPWKARSRAEAVALYPIALVSLPAMTVYIAAGGMMISPVDKWLVFAIGMVITMFIRRKRGGRVTGYLDIAWLMLFGLEFVQARGMNLTSAIRTWTTPVIALTIPYFVVSRNLKSVEDIRRVFLAFSFVGFVLGFISLIETTTHWLIYQSLYETLHLPRGGVSLYLKIRSGLLRAPTSFDESTSFGLFLAFTMMFCMAGRDVFKKKRGWLIALGVMFLGTVAANSRNAWVALAIGLPLYDLYRKRYASLGAKIGLIAIAYGTLMLAAEFSPYVATLTGQTADTSSTAEYRRLLLQRGLEEARKHPWTGTSLDEVLGNLQDMKQGEGIVDLVNGYLSYALTAGYGGAAALLMAFLLPCLLMFAKARSLAYDPRLQRYGAAICAIAGFSIVTTFNTSFGGKSITFYILTIAIGTAILSIKRPKRPRTGREDAAEAPTSAPPPATREPLALTS
ncbi:O-antigen ligase family protein [Sphingomonas bacterium]|uniref:O-antigen ligase family protein n=1 Tax=Sphingomonas bacterium TaxID=1895847 RepID=UPI001576E7AE|nr:O-antigen ligase family protein [Sphingomonas bacterium]